MNSIKQVFLYVGLILLSIGLWHLLSSSGVLDGVEQETIRWRYLARGEMESTAPIMFVDLDAETISYMGHRPWDRRQFGVLFDALLGVGQARVVSLDIILSKIGAGTLMDWERARKGEAFLGRVVDAYADRIVMAAAYTGVLDSKTLDRAELPLIRKLGNDAESRPFPEAPTFPIIKFEVGRLGLADVDEELSGGAVPYYVPGFVDLSGPRYSFHIISGAERFWESQDPRIVVGEDEVTLTDKDGWTTQRLPMHYEMTLFSLGLETFLAAHNLDGSDVELTDEALLVRDAEGGIFRRIPLVEKQSVEANWFQGWDLSKDNGRVSMQRVLRQADALATAQAAGDTEQVAALKNWFSRFEGKVVFVGPVDPQLKDVSPTPFNRAPVPKVGLHANLYRTIHDEAYMHRTREPWTLALLVLLTVTVAMLALGRGLPRVLSFLLLLGYGGVAFVAFARFNWILPLVAPVGSTLTAALSVVLLKLGSEEWQRRRIKALFGAYVAPRLVDEMVESNRDPKLGGTETEITALFSDVEGFSSLSEELSPDQLVSLMNEYLGAMTEVFQAEAGTLDKYIGDAIVTMFGMPVPVVDHAGRACRSAVQMQERHAALRTKWAAEGKWPPSVLQMRTRIGLNTGLAVIGNMGSEMRFNYTMMGDSVNLAARCESGAKSYGVYTMVTASTLESAIRDGVSLRYRKLDRIVVKGRQEPVEIYELWEDSIAAELTEPCREAYEAALELYFKGEWSAALEGFLRAAEFEPGQAYAPTTPSEVLAARCREFAQDGGPDPWDGAFRMKTK